jgi:outer membrane protein
MRRRLLPLLVAAAVSTTQAQAADLMAITRDALENSADLASSRSIYQSVQAGVNVQRGDLLPQVGATGRLVDNRIYEQQESAFVGGSGGAVASEGSVGGGGQGSTGGLGGGGVGVGIVSPTDDHYRSSSIGLEVTQAIFDASNWYEFQRAREEIDQQGFSLESDRQQLIYQVAEAYFEILRAHDVLEARIAQERAIERQLEQSKEQFEVGLIAITNVQEARAAADLARAERIAAQSDLQVNFEQLERLTGKRYESIEGLADDLPIETPLPASRRAWIELSMENNPLLLAARAGIDVANSAVDIARSGHLPTLDAFATYDYARADIDYLEGSNTQSQIGLSASLPIFTGGKTSAQVDQATYRLESTQYDFESQRRETVQQVRSLLTQVNNDVATVEARRQAIVSNRSALEATRSGYEVGTRNIVDVLEAEQSLYNALADYAEARYTYVIDMLALRRAAGILDTSDIRALNEWLREEVEVYLELSEDGDDYNAIMNIGEPPTAPQ